MNSYIWIVVILFFLGREVYLGYKYGTNEPLVSKKSLQRQIKWIFLICCFCFVIVEFALPFKKSEFIILDVVEEDLQETIEFTSNFNLENYKYYQEKYLQHEFEFHVDTKQQVVTSYKFSGVINNLNFFIVENEDLYDTIKFKLLETPTYNMAKKITVLDTHDVRITEIMENNFSIYIYKEPLKVNWLEDGYFYNAPWGAQDHGNIRKNVSKVIYLIIEVPKGVELEPSFNYLY